MEKNKKIGRKKEKRHSVKLHYSSPGPSGGL
jgi:hypothetical protein